ncbi:SDR family oxidoreductase [Hymenobacter gummosus]|uniref:SDR family oxidoreductase n=1 Tax=Hymenobacter gummosus TaxID=1776032 RepID=A0A431TXX0_9BACT|nr:SDR family oxidoreductase [Hymenobacter gummosus]RTQ47122.1 SDR family oxidoreductase [Hymenobacter gummosus]
MRVFVTGATGFVGSAVVQELLGAGHQVLGLARSEESARALAATGADVHRGTLEDLDSLRRGAAATDGVIHTGFVHDFNNFPAAVQTDRRAIEALGTALLGSDRPLIVTSGFGGLSSGGRPATEDDVRPADVPAVRLSEDAGLAFAAQGVRATAIRLGASVHDRGDHGFVPYLIQLAREKGEAAYIGDGLNRWPTVHRLDAARLYRLVLEQSPAGARYHGVAEEGIPLRDIAEAIGRHLGVPVVSKSREEAGAHFGWMAGFASLDIPASSALTQQRLGWQPQHIGLLADLAQGHYFA